MNVKQKIFLILGLFLVLIICLLFWVVKPMFLEIKKASAAIKESRDKLLLLERTDQDYLLEVESDYKEISDNLNLVKDGLVASEQAVEFFVALENIAAATANKLEIKATDFPLLILTLNGTFPDIVKFLGWLEKGKYFLDVESIDIKQVAQEGLDTSIENVRAIMEIKTYSKK